MKPARHADLITRIVNGERPVLQYKQFSTGPWIDAYTSPYDPLYSVYWLLDAGESYEVRVKPEPVPDEVYYDVIRMAGGRKSAKIVEVGGAARQAYSTLEGLKQVWKYRDNVVYVKLTIKTDDNGQKTKHVEIVE